MPKPVPWNSMTAAERRVAVAKDVLAQIEAENYVPRRMTYIVPHHRAESVAPLTSALHEALPKMGACAVCAVGATFLSAVRLFDRVTVAEFNAGLAVVIDLARRLFGDKQYRLIERTFEAGWAMGGLDEKTAEAVRRFHDTYLTDRDRMEAIMRNIIANGGTFRPEREFRRMDKGKGTGAAESQGARL